MSKVMDAAVAAYLESEDADGPVVEWHSDAVRRHLTAALAVVGRERDRAIKILEYALHLRMHGERAPGGTETWAQFDRDAEEFLRSLT